MKISTLLILLLIGTQSVFSQSLEKEYMKFKKDTTTLRYKNNQFSLDSLLSARKLSHPNITVRLIKKMMYNESYCDLYKKAICLSFKDDEVFDCLLCQEETDLKLLIAKYPNLFKDDYYKRILFTQDQY